MATQRVAYKGKRELTMAQFEVLTELDDAVDYDITDYPNTSITNTQMAAALGYSMLFNNNEIFVCSDDGTYTKGHIYQIQTEDGVKSWVDITSASEAGAISFKHSSLENADTDSAKEDTWTTDDIDTTLSVKHENGETQAGVSVSKNYADISAISTGESAGSSKASVTSDGVLLSAQSEVEGVQNYIKVGYNETTFSSTPKVVTSSSDTEQTTSDVVIKDDLANYVPRQSESENIYSQVLNENGEFAVSISDNGDVANFKVTKEDVTYNGESLLKSSTILSDEPYTLTEEEKSQICENIGSVKAQTCESGIVKAYVISGSNPNDVCRVDSSGLGLAIARFDSNGLISLRSDPSSDNHATRKSYVDGLFQSALDAIPDEHEKTQIYKHKIMLAISDSSYLAFVFFSTSGTAMTKSAFLPTETTSRYMDLSARRQTAETSTGHGVIGHIGNLTSSSIEFIRYDGEKETITIDDSVTLADVVFEL